MNRAETRSFDIARLLVMTVLLLASFSASAIDSVSSASASSSYGVWAVHHVNIAFDTLEQHGTPEMPPHCHMRSSHPQEVGPAQATVNDGLPTPALRGTSARARDAGTQLPAILARIPIPAPPRFILFGNFRS